MASKQQVGGDTIPSSSEFLSWGALTLSNAIQKSRKISCHDLMVATLDQIDAINPKCNAIILQKDRENLLTKAKEADDELQKQDNGRGWLHGIPIAIKDLSNAKGFPTTKGGSRLFADSGPATQNDAHVEKLVQAGAIVIGKTNTPEGGLGSNTFNDRFGATCNPFDLSKTAGGSSGGAAVAVATQMLAIADGSDNLGSLRNPAGWNNIYSIRPTAGLVPGDPVDDVISAASKVMSHPDATTGPMARTPKDVAMLLQTMVGNEDAFDASKLVNNSQNHQQNSVRVGWLGDWGGSLPFEDGILSHCRKALDAWSTGASKHNPLSEVQVIDVQDKIALFPFDELWRAYNSVRFAATLEKYEKDFDADELIKQRGTLIKEELAWEMEQGKAVTEQDLRRAKDIHKSFAATWINDAMQEFDVLALPSAQVWPFPIDCRYPKRIGDTKMETYHQWMQVCAPVSFAGLPCVTIPAGFESGLPMGIQLLARRGDDFKLLSLANDYHEAAKNVQPSVRIVLEDSAVLSISKQ